MPPPTRRPRTSLPGPSGADDISHLTLPEIRIRLERNERVLSSSLFSTSTPTSPTTSPIQPTSPPSDPILSKLLQARQSLLEREQVLVLQESMDHMDIKPDIKPDINHAESSTGARRRSSSTSLPYPPPNGGRSGKAKALEVIQAGEHRLAPNSLILPVAQTLALGQRDSAQATAQSLSNLSLTAHPPAPRSKYSKVAVPNVDDEISRAQAQARMQAFMTYKGDEEEDDEDGFFNEDENWGMEDENGYEGVEVGAEGRGTVRRAKGTGEEMDEFGEDDEEWAEGNDEYLDKNR